MLNIKKYCEYLYNSLYIPIYLYTNKTLTKCYPLQDKVTYPPSSYISCFWKTDKTVTYMMTSYYCYYGYIKIENTNSCLIIGPISNLPYTKDSLFVMHKEFSINDSDAEAFSNFFNNIPAENPEAFINTLLFINYTINDRELTRKDILNSEPYGLDANINREYSEILFFSKEECTINDNSEIEKELIRYIKKGKSKDILDLYKRSKNTKSGIIANNNIRQLKNEFIVAVTLACRAAISGGLSSSIAYPLAGIYMQHVERLIERDAITSLLEQAILDFTKRVASSAIPTNTDSILYNAVQYVRQNTNQNITVSDVADHVGFSRSYLSRKFKKEIGFELSAFIRQCKLEEAKDLLAYSNKSISEISNYFCFSSQSHFQKAFKNQFGITPQAYRKSL